MKITISVSDLQDVKSETGEVTSVQGVIYERDFDWSYPPQIGAELFAAGLGLLGVVRKLNGVISESGELSYLVLLESKYPKRRGEEYTSVGWVRTS